MNCGSHINTFRIRYPRNDSPAFRRSEGMSSTASASLTVSPSNIPDQVKLVLASAMWNKPHVIILDEPTNYLDREALGALVRARRIHTYKHASFNIYYEDTYMHRPFLKWSCRLLTNTITFPPLQSVNPDGLTISVSFLPDASDQVLRRRHRDHFAQPGVHRRPVHGEVARAGWTVLHTRVIFKKTFLYYYCDQGRTMMYICLYVCRGAEEVALKSSSLKKSTSAPADLDNAAPKVLLLPPRSFKGLSTLLCPLFRRMPVVT
jgi:hypothetical protein